MTLFGRTTNYKFKLIDFDIATWHDDEYSNWRAIDALLASFIAAPNFQGVWANGTVYSINDLAADAVSGEVFECLVNHTAAATPTLFSADRTANPTFWQVWLIAHTGDTGNPHAVTAAQTGALSFVSDIFANRPAASTVDNIFIATDTRVIYRDTGTIWEELGRDPSLILAGDLGFDPATQAELDTHEADVANPHSVTLAQVGAQPLDATLTAYAALVGAADKLPYFTGDDAFALTTLTAVGRTLIGAVDAEAQRAVIGAQIDNDPINFVRDCGGVGDDSTDNDTALTAMKTFIDAGRRHIYFPPGTYRYGIWPTITKQNVVLTGAGGGRRQLNDNTTHFKFTGAGTSLITMANVQGWSLRDFSIQDISGTAETVKANSVGFDLSAVQNCKFENLSVLGAVGVGGADKAGLKLDTSTTASCIYNTFINFNAIDIVNGVGGGDGYGLWLTETDVGSGKATNGNVFISCNFGKCDFGVFTEDTPNENTWINLEVAACDVGMTLRGRNNLILSANIESCVTTGIIVEDVVGCTVIALGIHLENNGTNWTNTGNKPFYLASNVTGEFLAVHSGGIGVGGATPAADALSFGGSWTIREAGTSAIGGTTTDVRLLLPAKVQDTGARLYAGTGDPGVTALVATRGSLFLRTDGGAGTSLYVKESDTGSSNWVAK